MGYQVRQFIVGQKQKTDGATLLLLSSLQRHRSNEPTTLFSLTDSEYDGVSILRRRICIPLQLKLRLKSCHGARRILFVWGCALNRSRDKLSRESLSSITEKVELYII